MFERRSKKRFPAEKCVVTYSKSNLFSFLKKAPPSTYPLINMSTGGLQFLANDSLSRGVPLDMTVKVPGYVDPIKMKGKVSWSKKIPQGLYRIGVQFTKVSKDAKQVLMELEQKGGLRYKEARETYWK